MTQNNARQPLSKVYVALAKGSSGGGAIDGQIDYDHLTREQQRVLIRLFGGGTLRGQNESTISGLHRLGLIKGETLTSLGKNSLRASSSSYTCSLRLGLANFGRAPNGSRSLKLPRRHEH